MLEVLEACLLIGHDLIYYGTIRSNPTESSAAPPHVSNKPRSTSETPFLSSSSSSCPTIPSRFDPVMESPHHPGFDPTLSRFVFAVQWKVHSFEMQDTHNTVEALLTSATNIYPLC